MVNLAPPSQVMSVLQGPGKWWTIISATLQFFVDIDWGFLICIVWSLEWCIDAILPVIKSIIDGVVESSDLTGEDVVPAFWFSMVHGKRLKILFKPGSKVVAVVVLVGVMLPFAPVRLSSEFRELAVSSYFMLQLPKSSIAGAGNTALILHTSFVGMKSGTNETNVDLWTHDLTYGWKKLSSWPHLLSRTLFPLKQV